MLTLDMTQGKSQIVMSKTDKFEPFFSFFYQKNEKNEIFLANFLTLKRCISWTIGPTVSNQLVWITDHTVFLTHLVWYCVIGIFADYLPATA